MLRQGQSHGTDLDGNLNLPERLETRPSRLLVLLVSLGVGAAILWASLTSISEVISAEGEVSTQARVNLVQHPTGGIVQEIFVESSSDVVAGSSLLSFDVSEVKSELAKAHSRKDFLNDEVRRAERMLIDQDTRQLTVGPEIAFEDIVLRSVQEHLLTQLELIDAQKHSFVSAIKISEERLENVDRERQILEKRKARYRPLLDAGIFSVVEWEAMERDTLRLAEQASSLNAQLNEQRGAVRESDLRRREVVTGSRLEAARRASELRNEIAAVLEDISVLETRIERSVVTASISGTVLNLNAAYPGQVLGPGDPIAEIVQADGPLEVEVEVGADELGSIGRGMEARVKVNSYDFTRYGHIVGQVKSVSPTSVANLAQDPVFIVRISLPSDGDHVSSLERPLRAGMTVTAEILSNRKTVLSYLLKPLRSISDGVFTEA